MFCANCGKMLPEKATTCPYCNSSFTDINSDKPIVTATISVPTERELLIAKFNSCQEIINKIMQQENILSNCQIKKKQYIYNPGLRLIIFFLKWLLIGSFTFSFVTVGIGLVGLGFSLIGDNYKGFIISSTTGIVLIAIPTIPLFLPIINKIKKKKNAEKATIEIEKLMRSPELTWLPYDYRDSYSFNTIKQYLVNRRADTLKEAINMYEIYG